MTALIQRVKDWLLERRIKRYGQMISEAIRVGDRELSREHVAKMMAAIKQRSEGQWQRIERRTVVRITRGL